MKVPTWRIVLIFASIASAMTLDVSAQTVSKICDDVAVDSGGIHGFRRSRVQAVAKSHGLNGIADYVLVIPPPDVPNVAGDIKQLIVMADVRPMLEPKCAKFVDPKAELVNCAQSIPGHGLKLIVKFKGDDPEKYKERMPSIMDYLTREVLCSGLSARR